MLAASRLVQVVGATLHIVAGCLRRFRLAHR
jgi:hypothetical protein